MKNRKLQTKNISLKSCAVSKFCSNNSKSIKKCFQLFFFHFCNKKSQRWRDDRLAIRQNWFFIRHFLLRTYFIESFFLIEKYIFLQFLIIKKLVMLLRLSLI